MTAYPSERYTARPYQASACYCDSAGTAPKIDFRRKEAYTSPSPTAALSQASVTERRDRAPACFREAVMSKSPKRFIGKDEGAGPYHLAKVPPILCPHCRMGRAGLIRRSPDLKRGSHYEMRTFQCEKCVENTELSVRVGA